MGIIIKQGLRQSVVTYIGVGIGAINVLFLYNKFLTTEQLGLYAALTSIPYVFVGMATLGVPQVLLRYFSVFSDEKESHNGLLFFSIFSGIIGYSVFLICFTLSKGLISDLYKENSPLLVSYIWVFPVITFFLILNSIFETYAKVHLKIVVPALIREIFMKSSNSALSLLFGFNFLSFDSLIKGLVLVYVLSTILLVLYTSHIKKLFLEPDFRILKSPYFPEMRRFALWTFIGGATGTILPHIEKVMLPAYSSGLEMTAIFAIALNIGLVIAVPRNAISSISEPIIAQSLRIGDLKNIEFIYRKSALNLLTAGLLLFVGIWVNIDAIFQLIPNTAIYQQGKLVVFMIGLYSIIDMGTGLNSEILRNSDYFRQDFFLFFIRLVLLIAMNLILIPLFGYNGAGLSMVISILLYNLLKFILIKRKFGIQPFGLSNLLLIILATGIILIVNLVRVDISRPEGAVLSIIIKSILSSILFLGGVWWFNLNTDFKNLLRSILIQFGLISSK